MKIEDAYCYFETKKHRSGKVGEVAIVSTKKTFARFHCDSPDCDDVHKALLIVIKNISSDLVRGYCCTA